MPQEQFQRVKQKQNPSAESSEEYRQFAQETMRSEIRRMNLEKTVGEQGTLSQAVVRIVNETASDQEGNGDAGGSSNAAEVKETSRAKSLWHVESNQIATVLNSIHQFKIQAHRLDRSRSAQEMNKHVLRRYQQGP